jgi:hypothetical protein
MHKFVEDLKKQLPKAFEGGTLRGCDIGKTPFLRIRQPLLRVAADES